MHLENLRTWNALQNFTLWEPISNLLNFLFPLICTAIFLYSNTCLSSLLFFLALIFSIFESKVKSLSPTKRKPRYLIMADPNVSLRFNQKAIFIQALVLLSFFLLIKSAALIIDLINIEPLSKSNSVAYFMIKEIQAFFKRLTPFILTSSVSSRIDFILTAIFTVIVLFYLFLNWKRTPSANSFSLKISDILTSWIVKMTLIVSLSGILIYNSYFDFQPSFMSFIELFLLILSSCRLFWAVHKGIHMPWLEVTQNFRDFFFFRLLVFLIVVNVHLLSDSGLLMQKFLAFAPELKPDRPNYQLIQGMILHFYLRLFENF